MNKIEHAVESIKSISSCSNQKKYCLIEIHKPSFFPQNTDDSEIIMLDGTSDMKISFKSNMFECFSDINAGKGGSVQRLHGFIEADDINDCFCQKYESGELQPLIFVTTLHLSDCDYKEEEPDTTKTVAKKAKIEEIKNRFRDKARNPQNLFHVAFFSSLDTADIIILMNSISYNTVLESLEESFKSNLGIISNTHVGYFKAHSSSWKENLDKCYIEIALKDISKQNEIITELEKTACVEQGKLSIIPYSKTGIYDILLDLRGSPNLTSSMVVETISDLCRRENLFYGFTVSLEKQY